MPHRTEPYLPVGRQPGTGFQWSRLPKLVSVLDIQELSYGPP